MENLIICVGMFYIAHLFFTMSFSLHKVPFINWTYTGGDIFGIDATTQIPESFKTEDEELPSYGYRTIGIPGVVAGLIKLHEENGILDLKTVMEPSISLAEDGFYLYPGEIKRQQSDKEKIESFEGTKLYFLNSEGESFRPGDKLVQKDLANTLKIISENGKKGFYEGKN